MKLRDSHLTETKRYRLAAYCIIVKYCTVNFCLNFCRKLAKSSFVLILLLGVEYFFFNIPLLIIDTHKLSLSLAICLSVENILNSLQVQVQYTIGHHEHRGLCALDFDISSFNLGSFRSHSVLFRQH